MRDQHLLRLARPLADEHERLNSLQQPPRHFLNSVALGANRAWRKAVAPCATKHLLRLARPVVPCAPVGWCLNAFAPDLHRCEPFADPTVEWRAVGKHPRSAHMWTRARAHTHTHTSTKVRGHTGTHMHTHTHAQTHTHTHTHRIHTPHTHTHTPHTHHSAANTPRLLNKSQRPDLPDEAAQRRKRRPESTAKPGPGPARARAGRNDYYSPGTIIDQHWVWCKVRDQDPRSFLKLPRA